MQKNVIISLMGTQASEDMDDSKLELVTEGRYYKKGDTYYVTYKESEVTGMEGTTTTLKVDKDVITLMRFGSINTQFIFEQGQKHVSHYDTNFGAFTIGVLTHDMNVRMDDNGGEIWVDYALEIDNNKTGGNDFHMLIREAGQQNDQHNGEFEAGN
jgi:uncharacterized beta-barrel protein YwiB (DUF1934 family)